MAQAYQNIKIKKSSVANKKPLTSDLTYGELAINYHDGKIYFKNSSNEIKDFTVLPDQEFTGKRFLTSDGSSLSWDIEISDSNITITDPQENQLLTYNSTTELFENKNPQLPIDIIRCGFVDTTPTYQNTAVFFNSSASAVTSPNSGETVQPYTFELADTGNGWSYYMNGIKYFMTGHRTITLPGSPPTTAQYFITISNSTTGQLSVSTTVWNLLDNYVLPVTIIKYNSTLVPSYHIEEERHTCLIDRRTHHYNHTTRGTLAQNIGKLSGYTINSANNSSITFGVDASRILDEDIIIDIPALADTNATTNNYTIFYRTSSTSWLWKSSLVPFSYTGGSYIQWDNNGTLTTGVANKYYTSYLVLTNFIGESSHIIVPGRGEFASVAEAQAEDVTEFDWSGLGVAEYVIAYKFIWGTKNTYNDIGKVSLTVAPIKIAAGTVTTSQISSVSHNTLTGIQGGSINESYHLNAAEYAEYQLLYTNTTSLSNGNIGIGIEDPSTRLEVSGSVKVSDQLVSTISTGTAPLVVSSTTRVGNLNVDKAGTADDLITHTVVVESPEVETKYVIDEFSAIDYQSCKYIVAIIHGSFGESREIFVMKNMLVNEQPVLSSYGVVSSNSELEEFIFSVDRVGDNIRLLVETLNSDSNSIFIKYKKNLL